MEFIASVNNETQARTISRSYNSKEIRGLRTPHDESWEKPSSALIRRAKASTTGAKDRSSIVTGRSRQPMKMKKKKSNKENQGSEVDDKYPFIAR